MAISTRALPWTHSIRAIACLTVIVWHGVLTILPENATGAQRLYILPLGTAAREAVLAFVILSAYLLGRHWTGGLSNSAGTWATFRPYLGRRLWRIVPPFWAAVSVTVVVMLVFGLNHAQGSHWDTGLPLTPWRTVANYLMITDLVGINPLNHPLWTVPVELHLYLFAPLIVACVARARIVLVAAVLCLAVAFGASWFIAPYFLFAFLTTFWVGARRQQWASESLRDTVRLIAPIAAVSLLLLVVVTGAHALPDGPDKYFVADALVGPLLLGWLFHRDVTGTRTWSIAVLSHRSLIWIGERSYSIYLIHALVLELLWRFAVRPLELSPKELEMLVLIAVGVPLSLAAGVVLYRLVELPSVRRGAAFGRPSTARASAERAPSQPITKESR